MLLGLISKLWNDEFGGLIATEYLLLGSIVSVGSATGLATVRDAVNDEYKEYGNAVREVRQSYSIPSHKGGGASTGGTMVTNNPLTPPAAPSSRTVQFVAPGP